MSKVVGRDFCALAWTANESAEFVNIMTYSCFLVHFLLEFASQISLNLITVSYVFTIKVSGFDF